MHTSFVTCQNKIPVTSPIQRTDGTHLMELDAPEGKRYAVLFDYFIVVRHFWLMMGTGIHHTPGIGIGWLVGDFIDRAIAFIKGQMMSDWAG